MKKIKGVEKNQRAGNNRERQITKTKIFVTTLERDEMSESTKREMIEKGKEG